MARHLCECVKFTNISLHFSHYFKVNELKCGLVVSLWKRLFEWEYIVKIGKYNSSDKRLNAEPKIIAAYSLKCSLQLIVSICLSREKSEIRFCRMHCQSVRIFFVALISNEQIEKYIFNSSLGAVFFFFGFLNFTFLRRIAIIVCPRRNAWKQKWRWQPFQWNHFKWNFLTPYCISSLSFLEMWRNVTKCRVMFNH